MVLGGPDVERCCRIHDLGTGISRKSRRWRGVLDSEFLDAGDITEKKMEKE